MGQLMWHGFAWCQAQVSRRFASSQAQLRTLIMIDDLESWHQGLPSRKKSDELTDYCYLNSIEEIRCFTSHFFCTFVIIFAHCSTAASTPNKECCWAKMVPVPFHQQLMGSCMLRISKEHNAATRATTTRIFFFAETDSRSWGHLGCFLFILPWQLMSVGLF